MCSPDTNRTDGSTVLYIITWLCVTLLLHNVSTAIWYQTAVTVLTACGWWSTAGTCRREYCIIIYVYIYTCVCVCVCVCARARVQFVAFLIRNIYHCTERLTTKLYRLVYTAYSIQYRVYSLQYTAYSTWYTAYSTGYTAYSIHYRVNSIQ